MHPCAPKDQPALRVLLDCTHTYMSGVNTGIQRVVRNLGKSVRSLSPQHSVECIPVMRRGSTFYPVSFDPPKEMWGRNLFDWIRRSYRASMTRVCDLIPVPQFRRWFLPNPGHYGIMKVPFLMYSAVNRRMKTIAAETLGEATGELKLQAGDVVVIMEPCSYHDCWEFLDEAKEQGVLIGAVIYDLIPLTHPHVFHRTMAKSFGPWFSALSLRADFFLAISETVRGHVVEHASRRAPDREWKSTQFDSFRLGCDLDLISSKGTVRDQVRHVFNSAGKEPVYLLVATVEPRKNHMYLLDAFEQAWANGSQARLCLIGRVGWLCDEIMTRIYEHPELGKRLHCFHDLSDTELQYCYKHARGLTYPSVQEGFGLPLIEALSHRLLVLASDIPVHREVGQDFCAYFDLQDASTLAKMIRKLDHDPQAISVRPPSEFKIVDWRQSCHEFLAACASLARNALADATLAETEEQTPESAWMRRAA